MAETENNAPAQGRIIRVQGSVIDIEFPFGRLPEIYNALTVTIDGVQGEEGSSATTITLEVEQHLGDSIVRAVALKPTDGLVRGSLVTDTGGPIEVPVGDVTKGHVFDVSGNILNAKPDEKVEVKERWSIHRSAPAFDQLESKTEMFETGIKVIYSTYESNETMYAKLKTYKDGAYDLVVPSTYYVDKMRKEGMIQKIDKSKLTNFSNLDPDMLNKPFDPNNDYSIPYIWGATAIGVNGDAVDPKSVTSWADLWKPEYKGSLLLTDDAREVFQMALRKLGYSGNTTDPKEIEAAYNELKKLMPNVAAFNSDNPANPYMEGEVNLGMIWNGSAFVARQAGTPIDVVWPKEGGIFWMDSLAIPANAKNKEGALKLINFLLRPDVAKQVAETIGYPTPNLAARKLLSPEVANDKTLYPDAETIKNGEWQNDVGSANSIYEEYYQKLKAGR